MGLLMGPLMGPVMGPLMDPLIGPIRFSGALQDMARYEHLGLFEADQNILSGGNSLPSCEDCIALVMSYIVYHISYMYI